LPNINVAEPRHQSYIEIGEPKIIEKLQGPNPTRNADFRYVSNKQSTLQSKDSTINTRMFHDQSKGVIITAARNANTISVR
jgi:hypothetical protein